MPIISGSGGSGGSSAALAPWNIVVPFQGTPDTVAGTWAWLQDGSNRINAGGMSNNATPAVNDLIAWNVVLSAGTWELTTIISAKGTDQGIATVTLGAISVTTIDCYNASTIYNQVSVVGSLVVAATGKYSLQYKMATKNASSTNFKMSLGPVSLRRTA